MSKITNESWINRNTGEIVETQTVVKHGDFDFHKIWLAHILDAVEQVGNAKMRVLMHLLKGMNSSNLYVGTIKQISLDAGVGTATVQRLLQALEEVGIITRPARGQVRISPQAVFKGSHQKRMNVMIRYKEEKQLSLFDAIDEKQENEAA